MQKNVNKTNSAENQGESLLKIQITRTRVSGAGGEGVPPPPPQRPHRRDSRRPAPTSTYRPTRPSPPPNTGAGNRASQPQARLPARGAPPPVLGPAGTRQGCVPHTAVASRAGTTSMPKRGTRVAAPPRTSETHDAPNAAQTGPRRRGPTSEHARLADRDVQG